MKKCKIGVLFDMHSGNLKFFLDGRDLGYAVKNEKELTNGEYYVTLTTNSAGDDGMF